MGTMRWYLVIWILLCCYDNGRCLAQNASIPCRNVTDYRSFMWEETRPGGVEVESCRILSTDLSGRITRECGQNGIWKLPKYNCIRQELLDLEQKVGGLTKTASAATVQNTLTQLSTATNVAASGLYDAELEKVTTMLDTIATVSSNITVSVNQSQNFINTASNLLDTKNQMSWASIAETDEEDKKPSGAAKVLAVIDTYASAIATTLQANSKTTNRTVENANMALRVARVDATTNEGIHFPDDKIISIKTKSSLNLKTDQIKGISSYSAVVYKNLSGILPSGTKDKTRVRQMINSVVLSLDVHGTTGELKEPVTINLEHFETDFVEPRCSFWNMSLNAWDTRGCKLHSTNSTTSVCKCTHLTNFAILMSPWEEVIASKALTAISAAGCGISLLALIITVVMHAGLWKYLKSDRTVILMNLSVALVLSYVVFLAGVDRIENKDVCTAVAAVLQYINLAVFFLMLVEGIEITMTVVYVFKMRSRLWWELPLAWGSPAIIVGISLGVTRMKGYGTKHFCWLSIDDNLIWAFVGPALCIILANTVLLTLIVRKMFQTKAIAMKSTMEKAKTGVKSLCVLLPLLGCTWVLGMFYINKDFTWVQYLFAVCNSLQGLVIFVFNCALNAQMKSAIQKRKMRYHNLRSQSSSSKPTIVPQKSTSSVSKELSARPVVRDPPIVPVKRDQPVGRRVMIVTGVGVEFRTIYT